ncbi:MAG: hypothetical protein KAQ75_02470, partial [Bacteroidales bacterium]|nr:hypothetical protein [Bacteroidales bacterium]
MKQKDDLQSFLEKSNKGDKILAIIGVPVITLLAIMLFAYSFLQNDTMRAIVSVLMSVGITISIWFGCRKIILFLWKKYPWEEKPAMHIIVEVLAVILWASLVSAVFTSIGYFFIADIDIL